MKKIVIGGILASLAIFVLVRHANTDEDDNGSAVSLGQPLISGGIANLPVGQQALWNIVATFPEAEREYFIDFGDSMASTPPKASGETFIIEHFYQTPGTYYVRARTYHIPTNTFSEWSESATIFIYTQTQV